MFPKLGRGEIKIDVFSGSEKFVAPEHHNVYDDEHHHVYDDDKYDDENLEFDDADDDIDIADYNDENGLEFRGLTVRTSQPKKV